MSCGARSEGARGAGTRNAVARSTSAVECVGGGGAGENRGVVILHNNSFNYVSLSLILL